MQKSYCSDCKRWTHPRMEKVKAIERHQKVQANPPVPSSLFEICASYLWKPRSKMITCHSSTFNCIFCFLSASHLSRMHAALDSLHFCTRNTRYVQNYWEEPGFWFYLSCNSVIAKQFILLHILYEQNKISNDFTKRVLSSQFMFQISLRGTNSISLGSDHLVTCYEIFILYLSQHLKWFSRSDENISANMVPKLKITCQILGTPSHKALSKGYTLHSANSNSHTGESPFHIPQMDEYRGYHLQNSRQEHKSACTLWQCAAFVALSLIASLLLYYIVPLT